MPFTMDFSRSSLSIAFRNLIVLLLIWRQSYVNAANYVAMASSAVQFKCKTSITPIWLENSTPKSVSLAYGTEKRATFKNER